MFSSGVDSRLLPQESGVIVVGPVCLVGSQCSEGVSDSTPPSPRWPKAYGPDNCACL